MGTKMTAPSPFCEAERRAETEIRLEGETMAATSLSSLSLVILFQRQPQTHHHLLFSSPSPSPLFWSTTSTSSSHSATRLILSSSSSSSPCSWGPNNNTNTNNNNKPRSTISHCASPATSNPADLSNPRIDLHFLGPKAGEDGSYPVQRASAASGEKLLRNIMLDHNVQLYAAYGKVMNCGGGGSCGTCIVEIVDGKDLLNERTDTEKRYLKKKPESWRLACQTIVGNKENAGKVVIQRLPQWKK